MSSSGFDRRRFGKRVIASSLAATPLAIGLQRGNADETKSQATPEAEIAKSPAGLTLELIRRLYPHDFDESQLADIRRDIEEDQTRSKILSSFALANADEPAPIFAAWRAEG
jgi:hypothetical protein